MQAALSTSDFDKVIRRLPLMVNAARLAILLSLLIIFFMFRNTNAVMVNLSKAPFIIWAVIYAIGIVLSLFYPRWSPQQANLPAFHDLFDIMMMVGLMHLTGGIENGFGILILPFIATSCLLSSGKHALIYASFAAALILLSTLVSQNSDLQAWFSDTGSIKRLFSTALLAICCFLVAILTSFISMNVKRVNQTVHTHEEEITRLNHLNDLVLNHLQEAVVVVDNNGKTWLFNAQANLYFPTLSLNSNSNLFLPLVQTWKIAPHQPFDIDYTILDEDLHIRAKPLPNQNPPLLILFMRPQQEIAAELQSNKLASLGQLTANIAHEIRNPLSAIRHANELLSENYETKPMQKLGSMIETNVQRIDQMVEEVLTLNRRDRLSPERVDLNQFIHDFLMEFLLATPDAKDCIRVHSPRHAMIAVFDLNHLQQIFWNLMNNAWRHSQQDEHAIQISIKPHARPNLISLQVIDNGEGVAEENVDKIFEPFFTTDVRGTGLGLYVARTLAQANRSDLNYLASAKAFELILPTQHHEHTS